MKPQYCSIKIHLIHVGHPVTVYYISYNILYYKTYKWWKYLQSSFSISKNHQIMLNQILAKRKRGRSLFLKSFEFLLRGLAVVQTEMITCFEINSNGRIGEMLQINSKNLLRDIIIIQLVIAECNVYVQS